MKVLELHILTAGRRPNELLREPALRLLTAKLSRAQFFGGIFVIGCANGLASRVIQTVTEKGWAEALLSSFQISLIVWLACYVGLRLTFANHPRPITRCDLGVGIFVLSFVSLPVGGLNWFGITVLASYILLFTNPSSRGRRGAIVLLATTMSMLWSRLFFAFAATPILRLDAALTAWFRGTDHVGNMVPFADGQGYLVIFPACSSFANLSLAFLTWILVNQSLDHRWKWQDVGWLVAACASVISVNVGRLSIMAFDMTAYLSVHSEWGEAVANLITLILVVGIIAVGARRELKSYV